MLGSNGTGFHGRVTVCNEVGLSLKRVLCSVAPHYPSSSTEGDNWGASRGTNYGSNMSVGFTETLENAVEPGDFARNFKTGGPQNGNLVTGIWFQSARKFEETGTNFMVGTFKQ